MMFRHVFSAEFSRQVRNPATLLAAAFVGLVAFNDMSLTSATASGLIHIGRVAHNAPLVVAELLSAITVPSMLLVALLVGPAVQRDFAHRSSAFYLTTPLTKLDYLGGRCFGALGATLLIPVGGLVGMGLAWAAIPSDFLVPGNPLALLPAVLYALPTLLLFGVMFFSVATLSRSSAATYVTAVIGMIAVFVLQGVTTEALVRGGPSSAVGRWTLLLADPTGRAPLMAETVAWSVAQRSVQGLPAALPLMANRAFWIALSGLLFAYTVRRFSVADVAGPRPSVEPVDGSVSNHPVALGPMRPSELRWGWRTAVRAFSRLMAVEIRRTIGHLLFLVLLGAMAVQLFSNFVGNVQGAGILPRTGFLLNNGLAGVDGPILAITFFFAGVLVWRERETGEDAVTHALPVSNLVHLSARFAVLLFLQVVYALLIIGVAVFSQVVLFRYPDVQPDLYVKAVLGIHLLGWCEIAAAMFFLQVISPGKLAGFALSAVAVTVTVLMPSFGLTSPVYRFGAVPDFVYSDMNGFGPFAQGLVAYRALWFGAAVLLYGASLLLWRRGVAHSSKRALRTGFRRLRRRGAWLSVPALATLAALVHVVRLGGVAPAEARSLDDLLTAYEARNRGFEEEAQATITSVALDVDVFPRLRAADVSGAYELVNQTDGPIRTVQITLLPTDAVVGPTYALDRPNHVLSRDTLTGFTVLALETPLAPGDSAALTFQLRVGARTGTGAGSSSLALVENGTLLDNFVGHASFFPLIGYRRELEIQDAEVRSGHGLSAEAKTQRTLDDPLGPGMASRSWVRFSATVSTDTGQVPISTGTLMERWTEGGRSYARFQSDTVMADEFAVISGRYALEVDSIRGVEVRVYHHPDHGMNVRRMMDGVEAGLSYASDHFGPYPYRTLTVVEVPAYGTVAGTAISKPGMFLWNETGGFISAPPTEGAVDPVFSTAAHESAHQWWGHQVRPAAFVEGALTLNETLAQYVRLRSLQGQPGISEEAVHAFLRDEARAYLIQRGRAVADEHPLVTANAGYIAYEKGTLAMAALAHQLGSATLDGALRGLVSRFALSGPPYATSRDLVRALRAVAPDSLRYLVEDWFETITLFDNRVERAWATSLPEGRWTVHVDATFRKLRADGRGEQQEVPYRGQVDVGVYDRTGDLLKVETFQVSEDARSFDLTLSGEPATVVLDPFGRLTEVDREDDRLAVSRENEAAGG